ncbi:MAG: AAA family ATPase, partial [Anaerolineae bacterium]|nr:AAA family ATPase [Anaerolineae bacterium]
MWEWSQIQAIADRLAGQEQGIVRSEDLDEPWRTLFDRVRRLDDLSMAELALWKASEGLPDRQGLVQRVLDGLPAPEAAFPSFQELGEVLPAIEWLWRSWIPRGMITLLGAPPGAGKSLLGLDLAHRIIHGAPMPSAADGEDGKGDRPGRFAPGNVIYVDAESVPQIQNQRALDWGTDRSRLYPLLPPETYGPIDFGQNAHQQLLVRMLDALQPELVVVDSLSSITVKGENSIEEVRSVLSFLASVAREHEVALLLIHHLRKRGSSLPWTGVPEPIGPDDFRG